MAGVGLYLSRGREGGHQRERDGEAGRRLGGEGGCQRLVEADDDACIGHSGLCREGGRPAEGARREAGRRE